MTIHDSIDSTRMAAGETEPAGARKHCRAGRSGQRASALSAGVRRAAFLALLVTATPALAHHGFGRFDRNAEIEVEGILTGLDFVNPHSYVYFDVMQPDGSVLSMGCEMRAATVLRRSGWSPALFVEGAPIVISGRPHRDDPSSCYAETLEIDGNALERYQQLTEQLTDRAPADPGARPYRTETGAINLAGDWAQEQYLLASSPDGRGGLVPKSMVAAVEAGEIAAADVPNAGWGARPVALTAAGEAAAEVLRNAPPEQHPRIQCEITSILFDWVFDGPINRVSQTADAITIEYGRGLTRTVRLDQSAHPADVVPSRGGHSIGHWEGGTLVVDTIGFEPGIIAGLVPHSGELHVVERFTLDPSTAALTRDYVARDPIFFSEDYTGSDIVLPADAPFAEDECRELAYEYTTGIGAE